MLILCKISVHLNNLAITCLVDNLWLDLSYWTRVSMAKVFNVTIVDTKMNEQEICGTKF